jgi:hypothetical protein
VILRWGLHLSIICYFLSFFEERDHFEAKQLEMAALLTKAERDAQKAYWKEHSSEATVEAMMLDSKAADIDKMERPEVSDDVPFRRKPGLLSIRHAYYTMHLQ